MAGKPFNKKEDEKKDAKIMRGMSPKQKAAFKKADVKMDKKKPTPVADMKMDKAHVFQNTRHSSLLPRPYASCLEDQGQGKMKHHSCRGQTQAKIPDQA